MRGSKRGRERVRKVKKDEERESKRGRNLEKDRM